jgi:hypothetical protein
MPILKPFNILVLHFTFSKEFFISEADRSSENLKIGKLQLPYSG